MFTRRCEVDEESTIISLVQAYEMSVRFKFKAAKLDGNRVGLGLLCLERRGEEEESSGTGARMLFDEGLQGSLLGLAGIRCSCGQLAV
jgi:hypothetical protein